MPTRHVHTVIDAADPARLARFWAAALGWSITYETPEEVVAEPDRSVEGQPLVFVPVGDPKTGKNRIHLELGSEDPRHQAEQVERLRDLGAVPVDIGQGDVPWVVLADPEGNELCVLDPRERYARRVPAAVVIDVADPPALAPFWAAATGFEPEVVEEGLATLRPHHPSAPYLALVEVAEPKRVKNRLHPDLAPFPGHDLEAEVARLEQLGARRIDIGQGEVSWVVLADPEGNELCVLTPR